MREYNGRINVLKDTMLFVVNSVFNQGIKESTTKENILKLMPDIYENANDDEIIKILPYKAYIDLEKLIKYTRTNDDIKSFIYNEKNFSIRSLEEAMIIVMRAKYHDYNYSLNPGVIEKLNRIFSEENKKIAKRYGDIELLTIGMLYSYGIVDFNFLREQLCRYMGEIITESELRDIFFTKLNLNIFVKDYNIKWTNTNEIQEFVTYLDDEYTPIDIGEIAEAQKSRNLRYKRFPKEEILKREEYFVNLKGKKLYQFLRSKNNDIHEWNFERLVKMNELGINILKEIPKMVIFEDDVELRKFMDLFTDWYNNSPQYVLGGYSPNEYRKELILDD